MNKLTDARNIAMDNVYILYLVGGQRLIANCQEVDEEKTLVKDVYHILVTKDEQGDKITFLVPFADETLVEHNVSYFYYKDILTIYKPLEEYKKYFLRTLALAEANKYKQTEETTETDDVATSQASANTAEVIHVDFKNKKRKSTTNNEPTPPDLIA